MASNQYRDGLEEARAVVKGLLNDMVELDKRTLQIAANAAKIGKTDFSGGSPKELNERLQKNATYRKQVNAEMKEAERLNKALAAAQAKFYSAQSGKNKQLQQTRLETNRLNRMHREAAVLSSKLSTEYEKQSTRLIQLKREAKGAAAQYGVNSKEARKLTAEANKLNDKLKRVDAAVGDHQRSVGNYGKAWQSAGKLITAAAGAFGVYSAMQIGRELYAEIKAINGLNKALEQVTQTQSLFNQSKTFLIDLAEETGVQINSLQQAYIKFYAASKTTNLSLEETQNLFRQTAKAGAVLNLSTDQVNGALTALEQMLSKGKVQAEEIRGQLGERLPGAFQILARSMGLTTAQLSKQLELGNVIADEVLPGFANELEKTFSLDKIDRVNTLAAAEGRLSTEWSKFAETLSNEEGSITKALTGTLNLVTSIVSEIAKLNEDLTPKIQTDVFNEYVAKYKEMGEAGKDEASTQKQLSTQRIKDIKSQIEVLKERQKQLEENESWFNRFAGKAAPEYDDIQEKIEEANISLATQRGLLEAANETLGLNKKSTTENTNAQTGNTDAKDKGIQVLDGSFAAMEAVISSLKEEQSKLAVGSKAWWEYQKRIEEAERGLVKMKGEIKGVSTLIAEEGIKDFNPFDYDLMTESQKRAHEELINNAKAATDLFEEEYKNQTELKKKYDEAQAQSDKKKWDNMITFAKDSVSALSDFGRTLYENRIQNLQNEIEANDRYYDDQIEAAEGNEEKQKQLQEEKEQRQEQLRAKQKEEQKKQAIFNKAFAIAEIGINTARAIAAALAPPPLGLGPVAGLPLSIATGALGAVQIATVLATPIPQLKDGDLTGKHEGLVQINDARGAQFKEIIQRANGEMEVYGGRNVLIDKKRGDKVYKAGTAPAGYDYNDIMNASINMSLADQHGRLSQAEARQSFDMEIISNMLDKKLSEQVKAIRSVKINNTINNKSSDFTAYRAAKFKRRA